jgi:hypothetical protein
MNLKQLINKTDELLIDQLNSFKDLFLKIGLVSHDGFSTRLIKGPLYRIIKLFDESKPLLESFGLNDKSNEGVVYIIKTINSSDTSKISGLFKFYNIKNKIYKKYVMSVPFNNKRVNLFNRYSFQKFGGVTKEELEEKLNKLIFNQINSVPYFNELIQPYLKD